MPDAVPTHTRPLRADARRNRELLVDAAREVFAERGLDAPLDEVARRAGVSIGTLYNRFAGRADLADAAMAGLVEQAIEVVERALATLDPWQGLVDYLVEISALQAGNRGFTDVCVLSLPPESRTEQAKIRAQTLLDALIERARHVGALRPDVELTDLLLLSWSVVRATEGIRDIAPDAWRRHLALLLDGLRADAAHPLPGAALPPEAVRRAMTLG